MSNEIIHLEAEEISLQTEINDTLVKANITEALIADLKERYSGLKLESINDRDGYELIKAARKECKMWRVTADKLCKAGREDYNKKAQAWIEKGKEVCGEIATIENELEAQEKAFEQEKERVKKELTERLNRQWLSRSLELTQLGAILIGDYMVLQDVSYENALIKECDDEVYNTAIKPAYQEIYDTLQADVVAKAEKEMQEREEFERKQIELKQRQEETERLEKQRQAEMEQLRRQNELAQASDIEKWAAIIAHLQKTPLQMMASSQYKSKMKTLRDCFISLNIQAK